MLQYRARALITITSASTRTQRPGKKGIFSVVERKNQNP